MTNILLSFIGDQDPYHKDRASGSYKKDSDGNHIKGPILSLLDEKKDFGTVVFFYTDNGVKRADADALASALEGSFTVLKKPLSLGDPKDHAELYRLTTWVRAKEQGVNIE